MIEFTSMTPIMRGWSEDKKYMVTDKSGTKYLLRISPIERLKGVRELFESLGSLPRSDVKMSAPVEYEIRGNDVCALYTWIEGEDAEAALPKMSPEEQYSAGMEAGRTLRLIHSIPAPMNAAPWEAQFSRKLDAKLERYAACPLSFDGDTHMLEYISANRHLISGRPSCFQHGDFHAGNIIISQGSPVIIDFDRHDFGDPYEEFNRIVWSVRVSPAFARGQLDGYFGGRPDDEFFRLMALYISVNSVSSLPWAIPFGEGQVNVMRELIAQVLSWYDDMQTFIPSWYACK